MAGGQGAFDPDFLATRYVTPWVAVFFLDLLYNISLYKKILKLRLLEFD